MLKSSQWTTEIALVGASEMERDRERNRERERESEELALKNC